EKPRNRLQKRILTPTLTLTPFASHLDFTEPTRTLYTLEYEPYPYNTLPCQFLGVYSTIDSVTAGAIEHGAYTFSREGLLDGSEYLSPTGRIKIRPQLLEQSGTEARVSVRSHSLDERLARQDGPIRSDIPHPDSRSNTLSQTARLIPHPAAHKKVFLGIRQGPTAAHCFGVYAKQSLAWGACLKNKASCGLSGTLSEESRDVDEQGMPRATARLYGCGQHTWFVAVKEVD
ncbi:hypothetical protein EJ07DRAFT_34687, partial [Lizonia empirigonia]